MERLIVKVKGHYNPEKTTTLRVEEVRSRMHPGAHFLYASARQVKDAEKRAHLIGGDYFAAEADTDIIVIDPQGFQVALIPRARF